MADDPDETSGELTHDQIRQVAELVYQMLLKEARTDFERRRITRHLNRNFGGQ